MSDTGRPFVATARLNSCHTWLIAGCANYLHLLCFRAHRLRPSDLFEIDARCRLANNVTKYYSESVESDSAARFAKKYGLAMAIADVSDVPLSKLISLSGRRAVVTGAAQGLGKAIARRLSEAGASVLIGDLKHDLARTAAEDLSRRYGGRVTATHLDVADTSSVTAAVDVAISELGGIDIWVNNAGIYPNIELLKTTDEVWDRVMDVNLRGVFAPSREAARHMIAAGDGGVIVNVVSTAGFKAVAPGMSAYVASKHGVRGLVRQMAIELAPHNIRVLGVAPTFCATEGNIAALAELPERVRHEISATLTSRLGRVGVPDDIGRVVLFCASDMSIFMTGSTLLVDAGEVS
jgi:NAD(P)-dependent dehydrogenase (short-subunit alcohol dehydrogenase family)